MEKLIIVGLSSTARHAFEFIKMYYRFCCERKI